MAEETENRFVEREESFVDEPRHAPEPPAPPAPAPPPKPSAGVSLWHKIFGSPAEQAAKLTDDVSESEHIEIAESLAEAMPERESSWSPEQDELRATPPSPAEQVAAEMETGIDTGDEPVGPDEGGSRERGGSRRRRRGRGGRGRGADRRQSNDRERRAPERANRNRGGHDDDFDDLGVEQDDLEPGDLRDDGIGNGFGPGDDLGESVEGDESDRGADGRGHRSIPSWDEAIGMIVDSNMQSRSERPRPSHSGRRGAQRGGRSRGGRRRGNPQNGN